MAKPTPYDTLFRVRKRQEDQKAQALGMVRRDIQTTATRRDEIAREQRRTLDSAAAESQGKFDAEEVRRYYQYERHLAQLAVEQDAELARLRSVEEERRLELEDAIKQRRMVERLCERRRLATPGPLDEDA